MSDLVRTSKGWAEVYPTHCPVGHRFAPHKVTVGWDGQCRYFYCEQQDGHADDASRWLYTSGAGGAPSWEGMAPDGGLVSGRAEAE
jgi:hypothetical protein